jgi:hypothetical protein
MFDYIYVKSEYGCNGLLLSDKVAESEVLKELRLRTEYSQLSLTGKTYYRKYKGQTEFYFPIHDFANDHQLGYLYLSNGDTSNIRKLNIVFDKRCGWFETFGKKVTDGSKL